MPAACRATANVARGGTGADRGSRADRTPSSPIRGPAGRGRRRRPPYRPRSPAPSRKPSTHGSIGSSRPGRAERTARGDGVVQLGAGVQAGRQLGGRPADRRGLGPRPTTAGAGDPARCPAPPAGRAGARRCVPGQPLVLRVGDDHLAVGELHLEARPAEQHLGGGDAPWSGARRRRSAGRRRRPRPIVVQPVGVASGVSRASALPMPGRAATMIICPGCRPLVRLSRSANPVGTPATCRRGVRDRVDLVHRRLQQLLEDRRSPRWCAAR